MSGPLDELREAFKSEPFCTTTRHVGGNVHRYLTLPTIMRVLDRFEAAHPGLVDTTEPCCNCGAGVEPSCRNSLYWSLSQKTISDGYYSNPQWWWEGLRLCPTCAEADE